MGPFTTGDYIRRCVAITNGLKPDLIALTGDYIAWDPGLERSVVSVLASLRAPHGVLGCLGNHEEESETEAYVSGLFTAQGVRILRQERTPIRLDGDELNLIGIDCPRTQSERDEEEEYRRDVNRRLHQQLVIPGTVNILLSHEPSVFVFDRAADLGIDLILAGHSHGGQLALEFVHRGLNLSHMFYRYTSGWYEQRSTKILRQPWHRHYGLSYSPRGAAGDHDIGVGQNLTSTQVFSDGDARNLPLRTAGARRLRCDYDFITDFTGRMTS